MASYPIYQFYAELKDYEPKIWRRFQVPGNITMAQLGYILMTMFEMKASHLFCMIVPIYKNALLRDKSIVEEDFLKKFLWFELEDENGFETEYETEYETRPAATSKMRSVLYGCPGEKLSLEYDFGDSWEVEVTLESITQDRELPGRELPRVLAGEGYGIVEDCGGVGGLMELAEGLRSKSGDVYEWFHNWLEQDDIDLDAFDLDDMNLRLKKVPRIYRELYEYHLTPTQRSIDFLNRKYLKK